MNERRPVNLEGPPGRPAGPSPGAPGELNDHVARIWGQALDVDNVVRTDDFFLDLGGHSLAALVITVRCGELIHLPLQIEDVYVAPTVDAYTCRIMSHQSCFQVNAARTRAASSPEDAARAFVTVLLNVNVDAALELIRSDALIEVADGEGSTVLRASEAGGALWDLSRARLSVSGYPVHGSCQPESPAAYNVSATLGNGSVACLRFTALGSL
jgi:hypothetical protein